jgi:hypothetical protein
MESTQWTIRVYILIVIPKKKDIKHVAHYDLELF